MPPVTDPHPRGPDVRFPPPFLFAAGFLVAWLLHRRVPFEIAGAGGGLVQGALGAVGFGLGLALMCAGFWTFMQNRTPVIPHRPARLLVRRGPYRFTRNPMYLGLTFAYVGLALLINWAWPLVLLPLVLIALTTFVIAREERYLRSAFGTDYDAYCQQVRRWL
jgi:protein-S-isoprenylcysteine O-methyltransferase Ste14